MSKDKITKLTNDYTKEQYAQFQKERRQVVFKRRRLAFICFVAIGVFAFTGYRLYNDYQQLTALEDIKADAETRAQEVADQVSSLQTDVALLKDDNYVLKLARSRYFYSREGETVYVFPDNTTSSSDSTPSDDSETNVSDAVSSDEEALANSSN